MADATNNHATTVTAEVHFPLDEEIRPAGRRLSPIQQFALLSLAILLLLGGTLAWILSDQIQRQMVEAVADMIGHEVAVMIRSQISANDLREPWTAGQCETFDVFLRQNILSQRVARIKIWNQEGTIIYADEPALVGQTFPMGDELRQVYAPLGGGGSVVAQLADLQKPENIAELRMGPLLEIYVPLIPYDSEEVVGAYEVYLYYDPIAASVRRSQAWIWGSVAVALAGLWVSLFWVFERASRAVERAEAERKRAAYLALLNEVGREAAATLEADELLQRAAKAIWRRFGYYTVSLLLLDRETGQLVPRAVAGLTQELLAQLPSRLKVGTGIMGHVAQTGEVYLANDVTRDPYYLGLPGLETRAELCVPLRREGAVIGVLNVESRRKNAFGPNDVTAMETLADQLATALTNAQLYEETRRLSVTDDLTGLANRRAFDARLAEEIRRVRRYDRPLALLMADIDHFKRYNDTYGHPQGDVVLQELAGVLRSAVRDTDFVARYGGEEFVVILPETDGAGALEVAEKVRASVAAHPFPWRESQPGGRLTISLGVAPFSEDLPEPMDLIQLADQALYRAKRGGRDRVCGA